MTQRKIMAAMLLLLAANSGLFSQTNTLPQLPSGFTDSPINFTGSPANPFDASVSPVYIKSNILQQTPKEKSPLLAAILSGILPGAGELYGKSYLKAAIFFGAEALLWGGYAYFRIKGDNKTDDFQAYANSNWSIKRYGQWLRDQGFSNAEGIDTSTSNLEVLRQQINIAESDPRNGFSHTLPELYSQQYYEVIGKYQPYVSGWSDAIKDGIWLITKQNFQTTHTAMFDSYAVQRQDANHFYNIATTSAIIVIVNHLLSAADAAWTVSLYNKKIKMQTGFNIKRYQSPFTGEFGNLPSFNLKVTF
jgi:hypothetical protein